MIDIDYKHLSDSALDDLLTETILQDGTDYGEVEVTFSKKKQELYQRLETGEAKIVFDIKHQHCSILSTTDNTQ